MILENVVFEFMKWIFWFPKLQVFHGNYRLINFLIFFEVLMEKPEFANLTIFNQNLLKIDYSEKPAKFE
jgi:hypothetical protein